MHFFHPKLALKWNKFDKRKASFTWQELGIEFEIVQFDPMVPLES